MLASAFSVLTHPIRSSSHEMTAHIAPNVQKSSPLTRLGVITFFRTSLEASIFVMH
jgi:hypothetical protein